MEAADSAHRALVVRVADRMGLDAIPCDLLRSLRRAFDGFSVTITNQTTGDTGTLNDLGSLLRLAAAGDHILEFRAAMPPLIFPTFCECVLLLFYKRGYDVTGNSALYGEAYEECSALVRDGEKNSQLLLEKLRAVKMNATHSRLFVEASD